MVFLHLYGYTQSYEIKLPSQAFLDGRSSPCKILRQVGCKDVAKFRLVTIDGNASIHSCLLFTNLNFATSQHPTCPIIFNRENLQNSKSQNGSSAEEATWFYSFGYTQGELCLFLSKLNSVLFISILNGMYLFPCICKMGWNHILMSKISREKAGALK